MNGYNPLLEYARDLQRIENQPADHKREAYRDLVKAINEYPEIIIQRADWLLNGSYGEGPYIKARDVLTSKMNKTAWLFINIAAFEWMTPNYYARKAYKEATQDQKDYLNLHLGELIKEYQAEIEEEV